MARLTHAEFVAWVEASCVRSGVACRITDAAVISRVTSLLTGRAAGSPAPRGAAAGPVSETPDEINAVGVEPVVVRVCGGDHPMSEDGLHDCCLAGEVQLGPLHVQGGAVTNDPG